MGKKEEVNLDKFFIIPIILLIVGFYVLLRPVERAFTGNPKLEIVTDSAKTTKSEVTINMQIEARKDTNLVPCCGAVITNDAGAETEVEESMPDSQPDEAYQYFLLASIIFIVLLILPRLKELTISKDSISLELIEEVQEDFQQIQNLVNEGQNPIANMAQVNQTILPEKINDVQKKIELIRKLLRKPND